jgi:hypothetical protein
MAARLRMEHPSDYRNLDRIAVIVFVLHVASTCTIGSHPRLGFTEGEGVFVRCRLCLVPPVSVRAIDVKAPLVPASAIR